MVKISEEGIGKLITKEQMKRDKVLPHNQCCTVFLKPEMTFLDPKLFSMVTDNELRDSTYTAYFNKEMDDQCKKIVKLVKLTAQVIHKPCYINDMVNLYVNFNLQVMYMYFSIDLKKCRLYIR